MISIYLMGGLGNQLFQIFTAIAMSLQFETPFIFTYSKTLTVGTHRPTYWDTLLSELKLRTTYNENHKLIEYNNNSILNSTVIKENGFDYKLIVLPPDCKTKNYILYGYYQSYIYFKKHFSEICNMLKLAEKQDAIRTRFANIFSTDQQTISMHFRIGDYKGIQDVHNILSVKYYSAALKQYISIAGDAPLRILYFYENKDNETVTIMVSVLKKMFPKCTFIAVDHTLEDWEQMLLMSICDHNIIANSTYSWWGAYFNQSETKRVFYPSRWFGPKMQHANTRDLFPENWTKIEC